MYLHAYISNNNNTSIKKNLSRSKKKKRKKKGKKKELIHLFTMRGRTCRINVMYFISCKLCETEKKITWHYLALFFSGRNKPAAKSCWRATFYTRFDTNQPLYFEI